MSNPTRRSQSSPEHPRASEPASLRQTACSASPPLPSSRTIAESQDVDVLAIQGDIADRGTAEQVVTAAIERFGRIGTLVNNAGIFVAKPFTTTQKTSSVPLRASTGRVPHDPA